MRILKEYNENLKILKEYKDFNYDKQLLETHIRKDGKYIMRGMFMQSEVINQNGRLYTHDILKREVNNIQKLIRERRFFGTLDHEDASVVNLREVCHIITELYMGADNNVYGTLEILDTPNGKILKTLIDSNVKVGLSSRGVGETEQRDEYELVKEYNLISVDAVADPSGPQCFMMNENKRLTKSEYKEIQKLYTRSDRVDRILNEILS